MIKLIIFDIGGVIDTFYESDYIAYITKKLDLNPVRFSDTLIPLLGKMEVGKMTAKDAERILSNRFKISTRQLEWNETFKRLNHLNDDVVSLANALSKNYKIALLTNVSRSRQTIKMQSLLKKVKYDRMFASCYLKMAKPDSKIYEFVLHEMKAKPNEAIFIDDLERNVAGARKVGITSIQFIGYKDLVRHLKALRIEW